MPEQATARRLSIAWWLVLAAAAGRGLAGLLSGLSGNGWAPFTWSILLVAALVALRVWWTRRPER